MKQLLEKRPYIVFLLPVFFILHGFWENAGFILFSDLLWPSFMLIAGSCILYLIFRLLLKDARKAGLMTLYCLGFYLFFGAVFDTLKAHSPWRFAYKYSVLLGVFFIIAIVIFLFLRRTRKDLARANFFVNLLFIVFILSDGAMYIAGLFSKQKNSQNAVTATIPAGVAKPDIYLLLFDGYTSSASLKQWLEFDNSATDSFLLKKGFHIIPGSRSNYEATAFSMASFLNMEYLKRNRKGKVPLREEIIDCGVAIRNNKVASFLSNNGYRVVNYSTFDLANHPAIVKQDFIPISTRLILEETLLYRLCDEFNWFIKIYPWLGKFLPVISLEEKAKGTHKTIQLTIDESAKISDRPRFVYSHFLIPHFPYLYDAKGNRQPDVFQPKGTRMQDTAAAYLDYLEYGNTQIRKLVDGIQANTHNKAVIILLSDHGFRGTDDPKYRFLRFHNLNALYLPDKQYQHWNDSVSNVNHFRILFNTLFNQKYDILKDSFFTIYEEPKGIEGF